MQSRIAGARNSTRYSSGNNQLADQERTKYGYSSKLGHARWTDMHEVDRHMKRLRLISNAMAILACLTIIMAILQLELSWSLIGTAHGDISGSPSINFVKALTTVLCILLVISLIMYYSTVVEYEISRCQLPKRCTIAGSGHLTAMLFEIVVCAIHCPPFVQYIGSYNLQNLLCAFMFPRIYLLFRFMAIRSRLFTPSGRFIENITRVEFSYAMVFKTALYRSPLLTLCIVFGTLMSVSSYCIFIFERWSAFMTPETDDDNRMHLTNITWLTFITVFTVGYGDIFPLTHEGRVVAILAACTGTSITALLIAVVSNALTLDDGEKKVVTFLDRDEYRKQVKEAAARCIQAAYFRWKSESSHRREIIVRSGPPKLLDPQELEHELYFQLKEWREIKRTGRLVQQENDISGEVALTTLQNAVDSIAKDLQNLTTHVHQALGLPPPAPRSGRSSGQPTRRAARDGRQRSAGPQRQAAYGPPEQYVNQSGYVGGPGRVVTLFNQYDR